MKRPSVLQGLGFTPHKVLYKQWEPPKPSGQLGNGVLRRREGVCGTWVNGVQTVVAWRLTRIQVCTQRAASSWVTCSHFKHVPCKCGYGTDNRGALCIYGNVSVAPNYDMIYTFEKLSIAVMIYFPFWFVYSIFVLYEIKKLYPSKPFFWPLYLLWNKTFIQHCRGARWYRTENRVNFHPKLQQLRKQN